VALPLGVATVVLCIIPWAYGSAQELPPAAAGRFQQAIEHLRAQRHASAEGLLKQLELEFPQHADIQEALAMALVFQGKADAATPHFEEVARLRPDSARAHQNLGANYLRAGRTEAALEEFQRAVELEPSNPTVQYNLGSLYLGQHRFGEALPHLQQAQRLQPEIPENSHKLALCHFFLGQHDEAAPLLQRLESGGGQPAEFFILVGLNHKALGEEAAAQSAFERARELLPSSPQAYEGVGQMFFHLGLHADAIPILEKGSEQHPEYYPVVYSLAVAYQGAGRGEEALTTHNLLGEINEQLKNYAQAVEHFRRAAELDPSEDNLFDLGYEFLVHWSWESAITIFEHGLTAYPHSERLWLGLGAAQFATGEHTKATQTFLRAASAAPGDVTVYHLLADAYPGSRGHTREVQEEFRRFHQRDPENPWANFYYGLSLGRPPDRQPSETDLAAALRLLQKAVALKPDLAEAQFELGLLLSEQGAWEDAVAALEAAVRLKPDFVSAHYRLALAYRRVGKSEDAKAMLARYQELKEQEESELERRAAQTVRFVQGLKQ
jgi:tetratricopeptide (TPR) repeat protein